MTEIIIAALGGAFTSPLVIWLIFFKWKKGALISELRLKRSESDGKLYDQLSKRIDEMGQKLLDMNQELFDTKEREQQLRKDMGVMIRLFDGDGSEEYMEIKARYQV